jgi:hypothetical protein
MFRKRFVFSFVFLLVPLLTDWSFGQKPPAPKPPAPAPVPLNPAHIGVDPFYFEVGECPTPPEGQEGWWGWHFVMPKNNNFTSLSVTFDTGAGEVTYAASPFPGTVFVAHPDASHAYIWTPEPYILVGGSATSSGSNTFFNLSHVCPPPREELTVTKTAVTSYTREHFWSIDKSVTTSIDLDSEIWLYVDGSGNETATWTVEVPYEGYVDSDFNVSGEVTIENTGDLDAVITGVSDLLVGNPVALDFGVTFPYTLKVGEVLTTTYDVDLQSRLAGDNVVTVTTEGNPDGYEGSATLSWGDPTVEINKTVTIVDDLYGDEPLGTATAPADGRFTYSEDFAWANYDLCGDYTYENTATIVETEQTAWASLTVHVQCYKDETAYAKADDSECFLDYGFSRWGWTNLISVTPGSSQDWPLWAAAGQCDTDKGTLVGSVTVTVGEDGYVEVEFYVDEAFVFDDGKHVYAGYEPFPKDKQ